MFDKEEKIDGFTKKYHVHKLVYFEEYSEINDAIAREKQLKCWKRVKKNYLIETKLKGPILELLTVVGPNDTYCADLLAICSKSKLCISAGNVKFIMDTTMPIHNSVKTYERILWYSEYTRIKESLKFFKKSFMYN